MKKWIAILALCLPVLACTFDESQLRTAEGSVAGADARLAADSLLIADTGSGVVPDAFSVVDRVFAQDTPCTQDAPTGVTAMADNRRVTLAWKAAAGAVSYSILRSTTTGVGYLDVGAVVATVPTAAFVDNDTSLVNGTRYYYVVNASNGVCASPDSVEVSAVPFAPELTVWEVVPVKVPFAPAEYVRVYVGAVKAKLAVTVIFPVTFVSVRGFVVERSLQFTK